MQCLKIILTFISFVISESITLQIVDLNDNPIVGANVEILGSNLGTTSDKNGFFTLKKVNKKSKIRISHIKYVNTTFDLSSIKNFKIELIEELLDSNPIVVTGSRRNSYMKDVPIPTKVINIDEIKTSSVSSVKELLEVVIPNVQDVMSSHAGVSNNEVKIKGLDNTYILFMIDGSRISGENFGNLDFNMLNISNVERIEVLEGGMSSLYGSNAIGGVVNIITKQTQKPFEFEFSYLNESPKVESKYLNIGLSKDRFKYRFNLSGQFSPGYDLTPELAEGNSRPLKTLEKYVANNMGHNLRIDLNKYLSLKIEFKKYKNRIYQYQNHTVMVTNPKDELYPFYTYTSLRNGLPWFSDREYKAELSYNFRKSNVKFKYHQDKYHKTNYYFNYTELDCGDDSENYFCLNQSNLTSREYQNAKNYNKNFFFNYDYNWIDNNFITMGFEKNINKYSSFNIYNQDGDLNENGSCDGTGTPWDPSDCIVESVFGGVDTSEEYIKTSVYLGGDFSFGSNFFSISARDVTSKKYGSNLVSSFAFMRKTNYSYDLRFNYSKGFRTPTIKELFYDFQSHPPPIIGNQNLKSTTNNYYSFSIDRKTVSRSNLLELYYNNVVDMIGTNYADSDNDGEDDVIMFNNYSSVKIFGLNLNFEYVGDINAFKFVYNYTNPRSEDINALELIANHSARFKFSRNLNEKTQIFLNTKFIGKKFINSGDEKIYLESFSVTNLTLSYQTNKNLMINFGIKNIFDYVDKRRFIDDDFLRNILSTYDPGQRFFIDFNFNL